MRALVDAIEPFPYPIGSGSNDSDPVMSTLQVLHGGMLKPPGIELLREGTRVRLRDGNLCGGILLLEYQYDTLLCIRAVQDSF